MVGSCQRWPSKPALRPGFSDTSLGSGLPVSWATSNTSREPGPSPLLQPPRAPCCPQHHVLGPGAQGAHPPCLHKGSSCPPVPGSEGRAQPLEDRVSGLQTAAPPASGCICGVLPRPHRPQPLVWSLFQPPTAVPILQMGSAKLAGLSHGHRRQCCLSAGT